MAKYKIVVNNSKQPQANPQTQQIIQQMAQNAANQQLQQQAQAQAEATDPMRQTVNDLLKNKLMNNIEVPQYTTIQDVLNANKGDRLSTFADFLSNPQTIRTIGNFLPSYGYNPKTGKVANPLEPMAQQEEALMQQRQAQALRQLKEQNDIATALNQTYMQQDIAEERNKLQRELAEQEMQFKREQMEEAKREKALDRAQQMQMLNMRLNSISGSASSGTATGGAAGLTPKQIQKNNEALNGLNAVQSQMDRFSKSFDKVRPTKVGALLAGAVASKGFGNEAESNFNAQKTLLFNKIARELGGEKGVLSDQDIKRIEASLPALSDSLPQKKAKMQAIYDLLEDRKSQYRTGVSSDNDPMGLGL